MQTSKVININKVIREIEKRICVRYHNDVENGYNSGLYLAIQIIKDNIKEVKDNERK
jgi:hypothetical protein